MNSSTEVINPIFLGLFLLHILLTICFIMILAGHFHAASRLLCGIVSDVGQSDSHVILLKCLLEAAEIPVAIEHITSVGKNSASMLPPICNKLVAPISSLSKAEPLLQLLQAMQERCPTLKD